MSARRHFSGRAPLAPVRDGRWIGSSLLRGPAASDRSKDRPLLKLASALHGQRLLSILFAKPRRVRALEHAASPDLFGNHPARIVGVARRARPGRHAPTLFDQLVGAILADGTAAGPPAMLAAAASPDHKIRAATVIHPNAAVIGAPGISLLAGCVAALLGQLCAAARVYCAVIPAAVVGGAVERLPWAAYWLAVLRPLVRL